MTSEQILNVSSFVLLGVALGTPILLTLLSHSPLKKCIEQLKPYLVYPSMIRTYYVQPLPWLLGNAPTVGQTLYLTVFFILNVILSSVNYTSSQPMPWGFDRREEILACIGYRTGHISYGLLPLLILFSGRNNFLLWITNWPFSTYLVLHRWISRIFAVQAIVHSITLLLTYQGTGSYATESKAPYWLWGIVATVLTCAMLVLSHLYFRRLSYEFFLGLHIILAILVIIGCWYHVVLMWGHNFYLNWVYAAMAVWLFDRLARLLRMFKNGVLRSVVTELGTEFVRIDIPGVRWASKPGHVAYAYFPTLHPLRPWENHPFSINSTALFRRHTKHTLKPDSCSSTSPSLEDHHVALDSKGLEASGSAVINAPSAPVIIGTSGVTLILKKKQGLTKLLEEDNDLLTLLDGPYPQSSSLSILECDRLLLVGGGIGITGLMAWAFAHPNVKLAWSVKQTAESLVREMDGVVSNVEDKEIVLGGRLDLEGMLKHEADAGYERVGVVVCGPDAMCDRVRALVAGLGRGRKTVFELEVDAFGW